MGSGWRQDSEPSIGTDETRPDMGRLWWTLRPIMHTNVHNLKQMLTICPLPKENSHGIMYLKENCVWKMIRFFLANQTFRSGCKNEMARTLTFFPFEFVPSLKCEKAGGIVQCPWRQKKPFKGQNTRFLLDLYVSQLQSKPSNIGLTSATGATLYVSGSGWSKKILWVV